MKYFKFMLVIMTLVCSLFLYSYDEGYNRVSFLQGKRNKLTDVDLEKESIGKDSSLNKTDLFKFLPLSTTGQIVIHKYYTLSYDENSEQAEWVAYELKKNYIENKNHYKRPFFVADPKVKTCSADWRNFKKSGFDKGHLCPAADMKFNIEAYNETFYMSNISPQNHDFNAGVWNRLEQKVRYWAVKYDAVFVVTGGILKPCLNFIGKEHVSVPDFFYKIVLNNSNGDFKMIAFLIPNKKSKKSLYDFVVSVDSIEKMTGIDFFPALDDKIENDLEKRINYDFGFSKSHQIN